MTDVASEFAVRFAPLDTRRLTGDLELTLDVDRHGAYYSSVHADDRVARELVHAARSIDPSSVPVPAVLHVPEWVQILEEARGTNATAVGGLAVLLDDDGTPECLRELARRYLALRHDVARLTREATTEGPAARAQDPQESHDAAAVARRAARTPNGPVHRILARLRLLDGWERADEVGLTGRELAEGKGSWRQAGESDLPLEQWSGIAGAWKRCSELAREGLIVQATEVDGDVERPLRRDGSRVWIITDVGLAELRRLDDLRNRRD